MDYGQIISRGWNVAWNNKWLFVLGIIASFVFNANFNASSDLNTQLQQFATESPESMSLEEVSELLSQLGATFGDLLGQLVPILIISSILGIVFWLVRMVARAGLVQGVARADAGQETSFGSAFSGGFPYLVRIVFSKIILALPLIILGALVLFSLVRSFGGLFESLSGMDGIGQITENFSLFADGEINETEFNSRMESFADTPGLEAAIEDTAQSVVGSFGLLLAFFCLSVPIGLITSLMGAFSFRGIVLRDQGVMQSLGHSWDVIKNNFGQIFMLGFIFFIISIVFGIVVGLVVAPVALMLNGMSGLAGSLIAGLILSIVGAALTSIIATLQSSSWTLAYLEMTGSVYEPKQKEPDDLLYDDKYI